MYKIEKSMVATALLFTACQPSSKIKQQETDNIVNPIITCHYSADPSARVFNDTLYIYPSHDRDEAQWWDMEDYHVYSTIDMKTFKDEGVIFEPLKQTTWAKRYCWAPDCIEKNGKYYLSYSTGPHIEGKGPQIGYVMADNIMEPYTYKGVILGPVSSGTNHHSIVEYKGQWYLFFHTSQPALKNIPANSPDRKYIQWRRSVCAASLRYNEDVTIQAITVVE